MPTARRFLLHVSAGHLRIFGVDADLSPDELFTVCTLPSTTTLLDGHTLVRDLNACLLPIRVKGTDMTAHERLWSVLTCLPEAVRTAIECARPKDLELDFAALFRIPSEAEEPDAYEEGEFCGYVTPRTAHILRQALESVADAILNDLKAYPQAKITKRSAFFARLPRATWDLSQTWRRRWIEAADLLISDLEHGHEPRPNSTAEEMVLWIALELAEDLGSHYEGDLPAHPNDFDWTSCSDVLYDDHDFRMLWGDSAQEWARFLPDYFERFSGEEPHRKTYRCMAEFSTQYDGL